MAEVLIGNEWIPVDETPAALRDAVSDANTTDMSMAPMASWISLTLLDGVMHVAVSAINGIRWMDDEDR